MNEKTYYLTGPVGRRYASTEKGLLGGYSRLKIYGRLDCPNARRYLAQGHYAKHRVFFKDEAAAIAAGYRPCGICMKEKHAAWKRATSPR
jgi:methylphosphotriester-DNA--protein-cysteine methyltransferase